jgi:S1-C subfamily serine protease
MNGLRLSTVLVLLIASTAADAATCDTCDGRRTVGTGPIRYVCPECEGTGETPDPSGPMAAARPGEPRPVVARVETSDGPSRASGSGVLVAASESHGLVLTNWHVVRSHRDGIIVHWPDGSRSGGRVVKWDDAWDLAAIVVDTPTALPVTIAARAPRLGDMLTIAGYGAAPYKYREESGACVEFLSPTGSHPRELVELRATARQGDSGGPIFNADGELAGVLFGARPNATVGPCSTRVRAFLAGVKLPRQVAAGSPCPDGKCKVAK